MFANISYVTEIFVTMKVTKHKTKSRQPDIMDVTYGRARAYTPLKLYTKILLLPGCMRLSLMSPIIIVRVEVPVREGLPLSLMRMGTKYSFCVSRSNSSLERTTAIPSPLAPAGKTENQRSYYPFTVHQKKKAQRMAAILCCIFFSVKP